MTVFVDLDGPILDVSERYYRVYADALEVLGAKAMDKQTYWDAKRRRVPDLEILKWSGAGEKLQRFQEERDRRIESDEYLVWDQLQDGSLEVLESLQLQHTLVLVTLRSRGLQLEKQLNDLGVRQLFKAVLSSGDDLKPRWKIKYRLILEYLDGKCPETAWMIGDTETDVLAGRELGFRTVAIINGIRSKELLEQIRPDYLLGSVKSLPSVLMA